MRYFPVRHFTLILPVLLAAANAAAATAQPAPFPELATAREALWRGGGARSASPVLQQAVVCYWRLLSLSGRRTSRCF